MTEDPIERRLRERKEKEAAKKAKKVPALRLLAPKRLTLILAIIAAVLALALAVLLVQKLALVRDLEAEKADLTEQMVALQHDFSNLQSDYENINHQLDTSRAQVAQLIEKLRKTEATNRAKIREYEKELGTLRTIMRSYIIQIDSLNTLNKRLTADAAAARREADENRRANEELTSRVQNLSGRVAAGSVLKARGIRVDAYNASGRVTDRSSRVVRLLTTLSLVENELADRGPVRIFLRVFDPEGEQLLNGSSTTFVMQGETLQASTSRAVDYEGDEVELSIYLNDIPSYHKGTYTVEAYTKKGSLGRTELLLR